MSFTVDIDLQRCQGHGKCMLECPEVFDMDEQGFAVLTAPEFDESLRAAAQRCVNDCPEAALRIVDRE
jgi:ferredoxin